MGSVKSSGVEIFETGLSFGAVATEALCFQFMRPDHHFTFGGSILNPALG